jgi:LCP family protein required for cell wall assembly
MSPLPSPAIAALLSFIFPGLGQWYAGSARRGAAWALPMVVLLVLAAMLLAGGSKSMLDLVFHAQNVLALIVIDVAFLFYHLAAMFDAYGLAMDRRRRHAIGSPARAPAALAVLVVLTLLLHGLPAGLAKWGSDAIGDILPGQSGIIAPVASDEPTPTAIAGATPTPTASPSPSPTVGGSPTTGVATPSSAPTPRSFPPIDAAWASDGRLDVLLIGSDAGPGRHGGRTDTMILLSVEITTGRAAMFGFPRNKYNVPVPRDASGQDVRVFIDRFYLGGSPGLLTNLWQRAYEDPQGYYTPSEACPATVADRDQCLAEARAWRAITGALQYLAGVPVDGVISVNLSAFRDLVDAVGGVWINVPYAIHDEDYPTGGGTSPRVIDIEAGCQKLDGVYALAFARSRHEASDYQRMRRQQLVLTAIRRQFDPLALLPQVPHLFDVAADNLYTTFNRDQVPQLAQVAARVDADRIQRVFFNPGPGYASGIDADQIRAIRAKVRNIFSEPEPSPEPTPLEETCPPDR